MGHDLWEEPTNSDCSQERRDRQTERERERERENPTRMLSNK